MVCGAAGDGGRSPMYADIFGTITGCESLWQRAQGLEQSWHYDVCDDYFVPVTGDAVKGN